MINYIIENQPRELTSDLQLLNLYKKEYDFTHEKEICLPQIQEAIHTLLEKNEEITTLKVAKISGVNKKIVSWYLQIQSNNLKGKNANVLG